MKGLVIVPAADVRPGEPRYWCEAGETSIADLVDAGLDGFGLHTESAEECACSDVTHAVVIRDVILAAPRTERRSAVSL